jgi:uncharacterized protein (DUF1786 family)
VSNPKQLLAIDVGAATQDIFLYEKGKPPENCLKMVVPSRTMTVARRIREVTEAKQPIFLKGNLMGGGACVEAIKGHLRAGLQAYATPLAAKSIRDNPAEVLEMGVKIVEDGPDDAVPIDLRDIDLPSLRQALSLFDVALPEQFAIAVQDHGECLDGSNRRFRFAYWERFIMEGGELEALIYKEPPLFLTRMRAIQRDVPGALVMDTGAAAMWGVFCDQKVFRRRQEGVVVVNIGNSHTLGALVQDRRVWGLFEHHTARMTPAKLEDYIDRLRQARLSDKEIYADGGHGCLIHPSLLQGLLFNFVTITGPNRHLASNSGYYFAVPYGDMMLTGCFGLLAAAGVL